MFMTPKASRHQASGRLLIHPGPKIRTGELECQNNADLFLRHLCNYEQEIRSQGSNGQPGTLPGSFDTTEGEGAEDKAGIVTIGRMFHLPWQSSRTNGVAYSSIFDLSEHDTCAPSPSSPDLDPDDFFFPPEWKVTWKGGDLTLWKTLSHLRQKRWTASKLRSSRDVSNSGNRDWISVFHPKESIVN